MLTLHLLGHNYISEDGVPFKVSTKAMALLTYLTLQRRPQHREHVSELLWNTPDALRNLRVELNRLQHLGLKLFPARQTLLELHLHTDLEQWMRDADSLPESRLSEWLSLGSSLPLCGLEDLGSDTFRAWLDSQRWTISQEIETTLSRVYLRAVQSGRVGAAALIRLHAEDLGIQLNIAQVVAPAASTVKFERQEIHQRFQRVLQLARGAPQLVVLSGHHNSGNRELVQQMVTESDWLIVQMQAVDQSELQQATFLHQLMRVLPPDSQAVAWRMLTNPSATGEDLIRVWTLVAASGLPLVIAIYDIHLMTPFLLDSLRFAMDLPISLTLVLSTSTHVGEHALRDALGSCDLSRVRPIEVPALSVHEVIEAVRVQQGLLSADHLRAYATRVVQQSEGWDLHARALIGSELPLTGVHFKLPDIVRNTLISEVGRLGLGLPFRQALAYLAMVYDPLNLEVASLLLGQGASEVLAEAVDQNLLVTAAPEETILMPNLIYQPSDVEDGLGFVSEALRTALAGTLTGLERSKIRGMLASYFVPGNPELARYYAERAGIKNLVTAPPALTLEQTVPASVPPATSWIKSDIRSPVVSSAYVPRQERRTGNGYRVVFEQGQLQILRNGLYRRPPLLRLVWPSVQAGHWHLVARLDVQEGAPTWEETFPSYALGLRAGHGARLVLGGQATAEYLDDRTVHTPGPPIPVGNWFRLEGLGEAGPLELSVRMLDVALTIAEFGWGTQTILSAEKSSEAIDPHPK
jgi:hypothetical protein